MATRSELYPSRWLAAADCETPFVATIQRSTREDVREGTGTKRKHILYFTGDTKPLICNATNFDAIVALSGETDSADWGGTVVELYAIECTGPNGQPTRGVRVRRPKPAAKKSTKATAKPAAPLALADDFDDAMPSVEEPAL